MLKNEANKIHKDAKKQEVTKHISELEIQDSENLEKLTRETMKQTNLSIPRMYGTIKIYQADKSIRPIVNTRNIIEGPIAEMLGTIRTPIKTRK